MTETQNKPKNFLGVDVGKAELYVHLISNGDGKKSRHSKMFFNTKKGVEDLVLWMSKTAKLSETSACLEHTGSYGRRLIKALEKASVASFYVVNPFQIKAFAGQKLRRSKTDSADAKLIAQFLVKEHQDLYPWSPSSSQKEELRELSRYAEELTRSVAKLKVTLQESGLETVSMSIASRIEAMELELENIRSEMKGYVLENAELKEQYQLLKSIPGLGEITVLVLIAELPELSGFKGARALAAWIGVTPKHFESGISGSSKTPITKMGNTRLRKALYLPALTAKQFNPILIPFAAKLKEKGKKPKEIIIACERKLIHIIYGILTSKKPFEILQ